MDATSRGRLERLRWGMAGSVALIAALTLLGWGAFPATLARLTGWLRPMPPVSAILGILAAAALVTPARAARVIGFTLMLSGAALGAALLVNDKGATTGLTALPQPTVIISIISSGLAFCLLDSRRAWQVWALQILTLAGMLNAVRVLLGNLLTESTEMLLPSTSDISPLGAAGILLLGLSMLTARPDSGWVALAVSERPAGRLLRWLAAAGILGPVAAALLTDLAWRLDIFGASTGLVLVLTGNLVVFYLVAAAYDGADRARHAAEARLAEANADLERRVAERTASLAEREAQISAIGDNLPGVMVYQTRSNDNGPLTFTYISAGVARISGFSPEEVLAQPDLLYTLLDPQTRERLVSAEREAAATVSGLDVEVRKQTPWGPRWSRIRSRPRRLDEHHIVWDGIELDITAEREVAAAIERDRRYQGALFACSQALLHAAETPAAREQALREALGHLIEGARADRAFMMELADLASPDSPVEVRLEICGPGIAPALMRPQPLRIPVDILAPLVSQEMGPGDPISGTLEELQARSPAFAELIAGFGVRSLIVIPLRLSNGNWAGVGFHDCTTPRVWDAQETLLLRTAAELLSGALQRWAGEDELRRREALLSALFDILPVGVALTDGSAHPLRSNRAILQIAGLSPDEVATGRYADLHYAYPEGRTLSYAEWPIMRALNGEEVRDLELCVIRPDGERRWVSVSAAPLPQAGMGAALIVVDITARKQAEVERLGFERKLLEAQRMESLGILAGGVAHDFNNILATILGHAELARLDLDPAGDAAASLDAIALGARRAADLTAQMLAYAGRSRFVVEAVDLNLVTRELAALTRATLPSGVSVAQRLDPQLPPVVADGTQVRQVLLNLLTNAGEATPGGAQGDTIVITTGRCELSAELLAEATVSAGAPGAYGYIEVSDTGSGIDAETIGRIFDPFFTTKFTGRGLGLAAVQGIIRAHRGALFVRSAPGRGATFRACFPLAAAGAGAMDEPPAPHGGA